MNANVCAVLKGLVEPLWNAGGWAGSVNFNDGVWSAQRE